MTALLVLGLFAVVAGVVLGIVQYTKSRRKVRKLQEDTHPVHWLSYLLICTSSVAVVLAIGHQEIPMLLTGDFLTALMAGLGLGILIATVWAGDIGAIHSMRRIPVLARNRQTFGMWEHTLYVGFVFTVEAITYGVVIYTLDKDPHALLSDVPLIPTDSTLFLGQVVLRVVLLAWTSIQLFIVAGKIAPLWSTLMGKAREVVGGHSLTSIENLDLERATVGALVNAYGAMSRQPARIPLPWRLNKWLIARDEHRAKEEERQRDDVVKTLTALSSGLPTLPKTEQKPSGGTATQANGGSPDLTRPPTGGGAPSSSHLENEAPDQAGSGATDSLTDLTTGKRRAARRQAPIRIRAKAANEALDIRRQAFANEQLDRDPEMTPNALANAIEAARLGKCGWHAASRYKANWQRRNRDRMEVAQ